MAEPMVTLYPATCLIFAAMFLVFLNRASIIHYLTHCAQCLDPGNYYVEFRSQTDDTEFESESEDFEDQWYAHPNTRKRQQQLHQPLLPVIDINRRSELPRIAPQNPAREVLRSGDGENLPTGPGAADTGVGNGAEDAD
ncbi:hypothetical protein BDV32DRAFT_145141 [Aspergillus pseudonomiae]|nr:hypothetical protein BDV32DRAFT_145141 [Aspergillus pseudonomiae]